MGAALSAPSSLKTPQLFRTSQSFVTSPLGAGGTCSSWELHPSILVMAAEDLFMLLFFASTVRAARLRMPELDDPPVLWRQWHVVVLCFPICGSGGRQCGSSASASDAAFARVSCSCSSQGSVHFCASRLGLVLRVGRSAHRAVLRACAQNFSLHDGRCSTASGTFLAGSSGMGHCRLRSSAALSSPFSSSPCSFGLIDLQVSHGSNSCSGPPTCARTPPLP